MSPDRRLPPISSVATLGSPLTFAGQATAALLAATRSSAEVRYHPTMEAVWSALRSGEAESILLTAESTHVGMTEVAAEVLRDPELGVLAEVVIPYHCALLGKPGTQLEQVKHVTGHGSLLQCRAYLQRELPWADVAVHRANSAVAAKEVLDGDGTLAVVGSLAAAEQLGLAVLARDVDDGSRGSWWVIGRGAPPASTGTTAVLGATVQPGAWSEALCGASQWVLRSLMIEPSGQALHHYRTLAVWTTNAEKQPLTGPWEGRAQCRGRFNTLTVQ